MDPKAGAQERLHERLKTLLNLSHRIHANPELGFEEERACAWLCEELSQAGFTVARGVCDIPTAFIARSGTGPLHVAFCAEYDALPLVGHACGHNLIAAMAAGAGIAAAQAQDDVGLTVSVIGTPAEEGGGGKILLLERGAFDGVHAAMMVHPEPVEHCTRPLCASLVFEVRSSKAGSGTSADVPEKSVIEAIEIAESKARQVCGGYLVRVGDQAKAIGDCALRDVPAAQGDQYGARYFLGAPRLEDLRKAWKDINRVFQESAVANSTQLEIVGGQRPYAEVRHDLEIASFYRRNATKLGRTFCDRPLDPIGAPSTDLGNVSSKIPSIHPTIAIDAAGYSNHQPGFASACVGESADRAVADGSLAMAWTAIDLASNPNLHVGR
jgi:metal-dependent amidase/aminoacylase/carboxypeptidase family protein